MGCQAVEMAMEYEALVDRSFNGGANPSNEKVGSGDRDFGGLFGWENIS